MQQLYEEMEQQINREKQRLQHEVGSQPGQAWSRPAPMCGNGGGSDSSLLTRGISSSGVLLRGGLSTQTVECSLGMSVPHLGLSSISKALPLWPHVWQVDWEELCRGALGFGLFHGV